jgi:Sigma-70, region 4
MQRSVVILKDVRDQSLGEIAAVLDLTVKPVKAHLARGRARLNAIDAQALAHPAPRPPSPAVARYVALFNRRDWDGLRAMLADDVRLIQSDGRISFIRDYKYVRYVIDGAELVLASDAAPPGEGTVHE